MKIAMIGYGAMGQSVSQIALSRNHEVSVIVDPSNTKATHQKLSPEVLKNIDVAIDFSSGESTLENLDICLKSGTNLVIGTTGWYKNLPKVKELVSQSKSGVLWSSNFSIGVNIFFKMIENAAAMINSFDEYDIWGHEIHHYNKADSPSGTAKTIEKILLEKIKRKTKIVEEKLDRKREPDEIHFSSVRGGLVNFGHTIGFDSPADTITISHAARNRDGYALGAVKAAEWLSGKKGYFEMQDFLTSQL